MTPATTPLECATAIVSALDRMREAEQDAIEAMDALRDRDDWPGRFFQATNGAMEALRSELIGCSGNEYDSERIYKEAVELRELLEIATLEDGLLETAD